MIRAYKKGDALSLRVQSEQQMEAAEFAHFFDTIKAYTLCDDKGKIQAVMGYQKIASKEAMGYALLGKNCQPKLFEMVRFIKKEIPLKMDKEKVYKVFITIRKNFLPARRLALLLGFNLRAELPSFFNGEDYQLLERKK